MGLQVSRGGGKTDGHEEEVGALGHSDYFGELALLFDRYQKYCIYQVFLKSIFILDQERLPLKPKIN